MTQRSRRGGSPLVGIFGSIAVLAVLLLLAFEFRTPDSVAPAATPGAPPAPK